MGVPGTTQYLPKAMPLTHLTNGQLGSYVRVLNNRLRKCLNPGRASLPPATKRPVAVPGWLDRYRTPAEVFWHRPVALVM